MLQQAAEFQNANRRGSGQDDLEPPDVINFDRIFAAVRRQWRLTALCAIAATALGYTYVLTAVPLYTASTDLLIDQSNSHIVNTLSVAGGIMEDEAAILSQVELLRSDKIASAVVDKLDLVNDPVFNAGGGSIIKQAVATIRSMVDVSGFTASEAITVEAAEARRQVAIDKLLDRIDVKRVGRSYVLELSYTSANPAEASRISSAIAEAYLTDQLDSKYDATRRASTWLQERIEELRQKSLATDLAVQKFRTENGLISAGGQLVSDQNLSELNSQLIVAQADTARAEAKYERIKTIVDSGDTDAVVTDALGSSVINSLREKFLESSKREAEITARLGRNHIQAARLRKEMQEYRRLIFEELGRIADSYLNDYQVAKAREESLRTSVTAATGVSSTANETLVQLRELERESESYKNLYQTFLQRYQEAVQQQSFPITEARVISRASIPDKPSSPKIPLVLALSLALGTLAGTGMGAFREFRDRFFRTADQVRDELGQEYLGLVPLVDADRRGPVDATEDQVNSRCIHKTSTLSNYVVDHPMSSFAETMRSAKIAADLAFGDRRPKHIGVVSVLPGEGKSTVAQNLAELIASQGARTLLVDADLRNPGTTRALARHAQAGVVEGVLENRALKDLLVTNPNTRLALLPAVVKRRIPHTSDFLASSGFAALLQQAEDSFDYIIYDLPPIAPVVDVRAIAHRMDGFVFVVEWGRTARRMVRSTFHTEPLVADKTLGVILNKADTQKMKLYRTYGSGEYYYSRYSSYYRDERSS